MGIGRDANRRRSGFAGFGATSGGRLEFIDQHKAVALPTSAYAVQFSSNVVGAMTPTNRQSVGRWIRETDSRTHPDLSPYLTEAFGYANGLGTPIILAIDLEDVATPDEVLAMLKASDKFAKQPDAELHRLAKVLAGIRGLTLGVTLGEKPFGKVKVDFAEELGVSPELAKAMMLHALAKRGAMLKELPDWIPQVERPHGESRRGTDYERHEAVAQFVRSRAVVHETAGGANRDVHDDHDHAVAPAPVRRSLEALCGEVLLQQSDRLRPRSAIQ